MFEWEPGKYCQRKGPTIIRSQVLSFAFCPVGAFLPNLLLKSWSEKAFSFSVSVFNIWTFFNIMMDSLSWEPIEETDMQQFCVEMMKRLDLQRRSNHFCDVVLEVGSGDDQARLKAHRIVLCAASPFFYNALNNDMKEKKEGVIRLENTSKAVRGTQRPFSGKWSKMARYASWSALKAI